MGTPSGRFSGEESLILNSGDRRIKNDSAHSLRSWKDSCARGIFFFLGGGACTRSERWSCEGQSRQLRRLRPYGKRVAPLRLPTPRLTSKSRPPSSGPLVMANIVSSLRKGEWGYGRVKTRTSYFPLFLNFQKSATQVNVKVIWASPHFGHPHSQNPKAMKIPCNPNPKPNPNR